MSPEAFFNRSVNVIADQPDSALIMGYVGKTGVITHQLAIATHTQQGQEALTVLTADIDPTNEEITKFSTGDIAPELIDDHVGDDTGPGVFDLRYVSTALGEANIALFELPNPDEPGEPGYWEGELQSMVAGVGRLSIEALGAKFTDHPQLAMDAEFYADLSQG